MSMKNVWWVVAALALSSACGGDDDGTTSDSLAAPSGVQAAPLEGGVHVTWKDNSSDEAEFMIERKSGSGDWKTIGTVPFNTTQYHDADVTAGTTYMYRVLAMSKEGMHSPASNEAHCMTPAAGAAASMHGAAGSESPMHE